MWQKHVSFRPLRWSNFQFIIPGHQIFKNSDHKNVIGQIRWPIIFFSSYMIWRAEKLSICWYFSILRILSFHCPGMTHITNLTRMPQGTVPCESGYWKFEKWKVKWKSGSLISRSEKWNENLVHSFREWKVKWKCLDIEIESEKWNENVSKSRSRVKSELKMPRDREVKFLENFQEILRNSWENY